MKYVKTRDSVCINRTCTRCGKSFDLTDQERMFLMEGNIPIPTLCPDCRLAAEKAGEKKEAQEEPPEKIEDLKKEVCIQLRDDPISNQAYNEALAVCGFTPGSAILTDNIDTVPFLLQKTNAIYIKAKGFSVSGFENEITMRDILEPNLRVTKSYAYRADNTNPLVPLFMDMVKSK